MARENTDSKKSFSQKCSNVHKLWKDKYEKARTINADV